MFPDVGVSVYVATKIQCRVGLLGKKDVILVAISGKTIVGKFVSACSYYSLNHGVQRYCISYAECETVDGLTYKVHRGSGLAFTPLSSVIRRLTYYQNPDGSFCPLLPGYF